MNNIRLREKIAGARITNRKLAGLLGISEQAFYNKLQGATEFKGSEIKALAGALELDLDEVNSIFFDERVN